MVRAESGRSLHQSSKRIVLRCVQLLDVRNNFYLLPAVLYSVGLSTYYLLQGISFDYLPALIFLAAVPLMAYFGSSRKMGRYWISIISIMLSYEALQGAAGTIAVSRGISSLYSLDRLLWGFNLTGWVQSTFASPAVTALTSVFYTLHIPLVVATCLVVWYAKRALFGKYVTAMVLTSYAALATFVIVPTAPPWYSGVASDLYSTAGASVLPHDLVSFLSLAEVDKFAAFPSLHGAYAIIFCYFMIKVDRRLALVAIPVTIGVLFSTLYLGQHYLIDLLGGAVYALVPCLVAERFELKIPGSRRQAESNGGSDLISAS